MKNKELTAENVRETARTKVIAKESGDLVRVKTDNEIGILNGTMDRFLENGWVVSKIYESGVFYLA